MLYPTLVLPDEFSVIDSKTVDVRRYRDYSRIVSLHLRMRIKNDNRETVPWAREHLLVHLRKELPIGGALSRFSAQESYQKASTDWEGNPSPSSLLLTITLLFEAEKPSLILSEEAALETVGGTEALLSIVRSALTEAQEQSDSKYICTQIRDEANQLVSQLAVDIVYTADTALRYRQRLAALKAERSAEILVTKENSLPKITAENRPDWDDDEEWFQEVLRNALTVLDKSISNQTGPSFLRGGRRPFLSLEDIEPSDSFMEWRIKKKVDP